MTWAVVCASSPQRQRADFSMPIVFMWLRSLQWPALSRNITGHFKIELQHNLNKYNVLSF